MGSRCWSRTRAAPAAQIGAAEVAKSAPDGYTHAHAQRHLPDGVGRGAARRTARCYNIDRDFAGVSIAVYVPLVITAHPSVPAKDLKELVELT